MPEAVEQPLVIAFTSPRPLIKEPRAAIRDELEASLPSHVLVVVLGAGMTADASLQSQRQNDPWAVKLPQDDTQTKILAERKALRADLAAQHERMNALELQFVTE